MNLAGAGIFQLIFNTEFSKQISIILILVIDVKSIENRKWCQNVKWIIGTLKLHYLLLLELCRTVLSRAYYKGEGQLQFLNFFTALWQLLRPHKIH